MENRLGKLARRWAAAFAVALAGFGGNASAILLDRGPDMVYDTVLDITWTRQAGGQDGFGTGGWAAANAWAAALVFGGFDDWRLPFASVSAGAGPTTTAVNCAAATEAACRDNEMGYMFYYNLDGNLGDNKTGTQTAVGGEVLTGIDGGLYWSGTAFDSGLAYVFFFGDGSHVDANRNNLYFAWAVRPGDVAAVPEPASLLLLGAGILGLGWSRRGGRLR